MKVIFFIVSVCFLRCDGFLLDSSATLPPGGTFEDRRYNMLMDLLTEERRSRLRLESAVSQELLALKQEVAKCTCRNGNNQFTMSNTSDLLSNETVGLESELSKLTSNYESLKRDYEGMKGKVQQLELEMSSFTQSKLTIDFQNVTNHLEKVILATNNEVNSMKNEAEARKQDFIALYQQLQATKHFEDDIQNANNEINSIKSDAEARKQDFISLFQRLQITEQILENKTVSLAASQNLTFLKLQNEINAGERKLETSQNVTASRFESETFNLKQELNETSNRVALTSCAAEGTYRYSQVILFNKIRTENRVGNIDSYKNSGVFKCENSGLYEISVYVLTTTNYGGYNVKLNDSIISLAVASLTGGYQTCSSTVLVRLLKNDRVYVDVRSSDMFVYGDYHSCFTILKVQ